MPPNRSLKRPVVAVIVDDMMASGSITSKPFLSLCIKHRHLCRAGRAAAGLTIAIAVQSLKSSASRPL
eukprot:43041-Eustigmatos_ZCMA.PRE.1